MGPVDCAVLGGSPDFDGNEAGEAVKSFYEMGLILTFMLLCVSGTQMILNELLPYSVPVVGVHGMDANVSAEDAVRVSTTQPDFSTAQGKEYSSATTDLQGFVYQLFAGWSNLLDDALPEELDIIIEVLRMILIPIQALTLAYSFFLFITGLRGGYTP